MQYILTLIAISLGVTLSAQPVLPYLNPNFPIETRVQDLLSRMTPEEKFRQLFMVYGGPIADTAKCANGLFGFKTVEQKENAANTSPKQSDYSLDEAYRNLNEINTVQANFNRTRLGIPAIPFDEALHGLIGPDATSFPQSIGLAATFDTTLMDAVANAIALETRARGIRMVLSPVVNLATDQRWGRVEETYGEDPWLSSVMGVTFIRAMERNGIIATPKHFVVNHGDGGRDSYPAAWSNQHLYNTYFRPFKAAIQEGGAGSIMTAYNSYDGRPCTANSYLLKDVLRDNWKFDGFVISDAGATGGANVLHFTARDYEDAGKQSVENGLDVIFQTDINHTDLFKKPFLDGSMAASVIDSAVANVLRAKFRLGLFENPFSEKSRIDALEMKMHNLLAYEAAAESAVLLRNENNTLPLSTATKKIAVIGTDAVEARLGGYSGAGNNPVSILTGIRDRYKFTDISYSPGVGRGDTTWKVIEPDVLFHLENNNLTKGLRGEYYTDINMKGDPAIERIDEQINFQWTLFGPHPSLPYDHYAVRWHGYLIPQESGEWQIGVDGNDGYVMYINDQIIIDRSSDQSYHTTLKAFRFEKGKKYHLRIEYKERSGNSWFRLIWNCGIKNKTEKRIEEAVKLAQKNDVVIVVAGIEEGEFHDRSSLRLPGKQEEMIKAIAATGKPLIVVLIGGSAITMNNWIEDVDAVIDAWYPGEMGGLAIADLLAGRLNPSGKLPITFPMTEGQLPLVYNHLPTGRGDDYTDGTGQALFPFGFGLSYTTFEYSDLRIDRTDFKADEKVNITFSLTNSGQSAGTEMVQLYLRDEISETARPVKELIGCQKIVLVSGEKVNVTFTISPEQLSYYNNKLQEVTEPGAYRLMIGSSSKDIRLRATINYVE